jgi:AcrR family transcriptional regulator
MLVSMREKAAGSTLSRRARPAKDPLTREVIVAAALDLLVREGLSGLSLRKVAAELDTGAASLYVYVANLGELQSLVLDQALASVVLPDPGAGDWRSRLKDMLISYFRTLCACPGLAHLALVTLPSGPNMLRITEALLGLLLEGGMPGARAAWAVDMLTLYVTAIAAEQSSSQTHDDSIRRAEQAMSAVTPTEYPHVHALRAHLFSGGHERFEWALDVLLTGLAENRPPSS